MYTNLLKFDACFLEIFGREGTASDSCSLQGLALFSQ